MIIARFASTLSNPCKCQKKECTYHTIKQLFDHLYIIIHSLHLCISRFPLSLLAFFVFFNFDSTEAWARKERLLQYDGESAERTVVLDDQADHFNSQDSAWLTEEERADAKERSDARSDAMNHRGKVQLNIEL
jgi:hypothetical protein